MTQDLKDRMVKLKGNLIRADGRIERTCAHGVGHPVGHINQPMLGWMYVHGCDGCCQTWDKNEKS